MKSKFLFTSLSAVLLLSVVSCKSSSSKIPKNDQQAFDTYWKQGKTEVFIFDFDQSVDTIHYKGTITFIFEINNISKKRGLKLDEPKKHPGDAIEVMQCNQLMQLSNGTSPSSMMTSVFTPLNYQEHPHSIKWVSSYQDWNDQTFLQANWRSYRYETRYYSSSADEGDLETKLVNAWLEDEIWNKIRVSPDKLPLGQFDMVPAAFYIRSSNIALKEYDATGTITEVQGQYQYSIAYPELNRKVEIYFEKDLPHKILGWKELKNGKEIFLAVVGVATNNQ